MDNLVISVGLSSVSFTMVMILIAAAGLLWAPFAAMIARSEALKRGLTGSRYAVVGAIHSVFLLAPWFCLMSRIRGDETALPKGRTFIMLYTSWMLGPILMLWILQESDYGSGTNMIVVVIWVMLAAWAGSILLLLAAGRPHTGQWRGVSLPPPHQSVGASLPVLYILPFACTWVSVVFAFAKIRIL